MKYIFIQLILLIFFVSPMNLFARTKAEVIKTLGLVEGKYEAKLEKPENSIDDFCENQSLEVNIVDIENSLSLVIGEKSYPGLEKNVIENKENKKCPYKFTNKIEKNKLTHKLEYSCLKNQNSESEFFFSNNKIEQIKKLNGTTQKCIYMNLKK